MTVIPFPTAETAEPVLELWPGWVRVALLVGFGLLGWSPLIAILIRPQGA